MGWKNIIIVLCVYGFLKEFRPSEPFISPFLNGPHKNLTEEEINQDIYPLATYSNLSLLVVIFLLTDWLKYKPIIILGGIAGIVTWTILAVGKSKKVIQLSQIFYGLFSATEVAYYSYMYAKLDKKHYQKGTSVTKAVILIGKASSGLTSQALLHFCLMDYLELNYITLGALTLATIWAFFFPSAYHSMYFHNSKEVEDQKISQDTNDNPVEVDKLTGKSDILASDKAKEYYPDDKLFHKGNQPIKTTFKIIFESFKAAINDKNVIKWSLWWSISMCGYLQVVNYMQLLWQSIINSGDRNQPIYHGYISTVHCIIGAVCTYLVGFLNLKWDVYGEIILAVCAIIQGCLILQSTHENVLLHSYILFIIFRAVYQSSNTIASSEIAKHIRSESYALVFGINTFLALLGQTILTVLIIDFLKLDIKTQFFIYGTYYIVIGVGFALVGFYTVLSYYRENLKKPLNKDLKV